jgi:hypothetical protein
MTLRKILSSAASAFVVALIAVGSAESAPHALSAFVADYDADKSGDVTQAEFDAGRTARFAATDANKDGWVSDVEYLAEYEVRLDAKLAASTETAEHKAEDRVREVRQTHVRFGVLDTDKDGQMTKAEYDVSGARAFTQQDRNKDGRISAADAEVKTVAAN